ncbi:MAG: hypothetical protein JEZ03_16810 [Bacteroidales bacterium]|nr:hypothetical protein [Bacteroidales bacterium]
MLNHKNIAPSFKESIAMMAILIISITAIAAANAIPKIDNQALIESFDSNPIVPDSITETPLPTDPDSTKRTFHSKNTDWLADSTTSILISYNTKDTIHIDTANWVDFFQQGKQYKQTHSNDYEFFFNDSNNTRVYIDYSYPDTIRNLDSTFFAYGNFEMPDFPELSEPIYFDVEDFSTNFWENENTEYSIPYGDFNDVDPNIYNRALFFSREATQDYLANNLLDSTESFELQLESFRKKSELRELKNELNEEYSKFIKAQHQMEVVELEMRANAMESQRAKRNNDVRALKKAQKKERQLIKKRTEASEEFKTRREEYEHAMQSYNDKMQELNRHFYNMVADPQKFREFTQGRVYTYSPNGNPVSFEDDESFPIYRPKKRSLKTQKELLKYQDIIRKKHNLLSNYHQKFDSLQSQELESEILSMDALLSFNKMKTDLGELQKDTIKNKAKIKEYKLKLKELKKTIKVESDLKQWILEERERHEAQADILHDEIMNLEEQISRIPRIQEIKEIFEEERVHDLERIQEIQERFQDEDLVEQEERLDRIREIVEIRDAQRINKEEELQEMEEQIQDEELLEQDEKRERIREIRTVRAAESIREIEGNPERAEEVEKLEDIERLQEMEEKPQQEEQHFKIEELEQILKSQIHETLIEDLYKEGLADKNEDLEFILRKNKMIVNSKTMDSKIENKYREKYIKLYKKLLDKNASFPLQIDIKL